MLNNQRMGQTTMVMIILIIVVFIGMVTFLLSFAKTVQQSEYINMYTNNLLSTIMKTDTGFLDSNCRTVSDLLSCSFLSPTYVCGGIKDCSSLADEKVNEYMSRFEFIKEGFDHLIIVESEGFSSISSGSVKNVEIGELSLKDSKRDKIVANSRITGIFAGDIYNLNVRLIVSKIDA